MNDAERKVRNDFLSLIRDEGIKSAKINWGKIIGSSGKTPTKEQIVALEKLYTTHHIPFKGPSLTNFIS